MERQAEKPSRLDKYVLLIVVAGILVSMGMLINATISGESLGPWIWNRHQHPFSWYSRPLFIIPACYYAYRRNISLIIGFIILMGCTLFWFPPPEHVPEEVVQYLEWEKKFFFTNPSVIPLVLLIVTVVGFLVSWFYAFWNRNYLLGLILINISTILKIIVSLWLGKEAGEASIVPSLSSIAIVNVFAFFLWLYRKRSQ